MVWDLDFKSFLKGALGTLDVQTEVAVAQRERKLDAAIRLTGPIPHVPALQLLLSFLTPTTLIEFKSAQDKLEPRDLWKMMGYVGFYCYNESIPLEQMQRGVSFLLVLARRPTFFSELIERGTIVCSSVTGVYQLNFLVHCHAIVVDELPLEEGNLGFLLFAAGPKLREVFAWIIQKQINVSSVKKYVQEAFLHHYQELKDMDNVQTVLPEEEILANISAAVKDYGIAKVIEIIGIEKVVEALGGVEKMRHILDSMEKKPAAKPRKKSKRA